MTPEVKQLLYQFLVKGEIWWKKRLKLWWKSGCNYVETTNNIGM